MRTNSPAGIVLSACFLLSSSWTFAQEPAGKPTLPDSPSSVVIANVDPSETRSNSKAGSSLPALGDQEGEEGFSRSAIFKRGIEDQKRIFLAPFQRSSVKWDLLFLAGTGGLIAGDKHLSAALPSDHTDISINISSVGVYSMVAGAAGLGLSGLKTKDPHSQEAGVLAMEAFANTAVMVAGLQLTAGRERPTEGMGQGRFWQNNALASSFPSGHSSYTWTMASIVAHEYPKPWIEWLSYGMATAVSVTRVTGQKHFSADVAVGGLFGYLIGRQVFSSHCKAGLSPLCHLRK